MRLLPAPLSVAALSLSLLACAAEPPAPDAAEDAAGPAADEESAEGGGLYELSAPSLEGEPVDLAAYEGRVTLVVNVASRCGYTPQYAGLQELHEELAERGFAVLAFPSNEFGGQEPGSASEIRELCTSSFGVTFPMFAKCEVKSGAGQSPVYAYLTRESGETPRWNFSKYLVGRDGRVLAHFGSSVAPEDGELRAAIEAALG